METLTLGVVLALPPLLLALDRNAPGGPRVNPGCLGLGCAVLLMAALLNLEQFLLNAEIFPLLAG